MAVGMNWTLTVLVLPLDRSKVPLLYGERREQGADRHLQVPLPLFLTLRLLLLVVLTFTLPKLRLPETLNVPNGGVESRSASRSELRSQSRSRCVAVRSRSPSESRLRWRVVWSEWPTGRASGRGRGWRVRRGRGCRRGRGRGDRGSPSRWSWQ